MAYQTKVNQTVFDNSRNSIEEIQKLVNKLTLETTHLSIALYLIKKNHATPEILDIIAETEKQIKQIEDKYNNSKK